MYALLKKISDLLNRVAEYLVIFLVAGISLLIFVQVIFRYVLNHSLFWSEELARYILMWITFVGASVGFKRKGHIGIDFIYKKVKGKVKIWFTIIIDASIVVLAFVMLLYGIKLTLFVWIQSSPALLLSMSFPYASIAVGGLLILFHSLVFLTEDITSLFKSSEETL